MTVADRIKLRRNFLGLSQSELAKKASYSDKTAISKIENAGNDITMKQVRRLAKALEVTPEYLMGWDSIAEYIYESYSEGNTTSEISSEDHELLDRYHNISPETRNSIDLLIEADLRKRGLLD